MVEVPAGSLYLGRDAESGEAIHYRAENFTTHGVIVGMTGSGKTGLGIILLEEALLQGIPTLVIDPKGDMGNLLLTFPELAPADFEPWISEARARRKKTSRAELAAQTAAAWADGLEASGITRERIVKLRDKTEMTIYTPGSTSGVPLNVLGSLRAPAAGLDQEALQDEIAGFTSGLLRLVGIKSDPLSGREHILISNLIHHAWSAGRDLDLATLIGQIQDPPLRKLGVIDLDTFFPPEARMKLALKINGLAASPTFASWTTGAPLDVERLLYGDEHTPQASVISIAHLDEEERQYVVTTVLSKVVTWMRSQSGTSELRALIYMDEVFGFVPPTAAPPSKKPILTLLKQARAFGVGLVLSTQNPVDIDYKALSNAGTWMIGRLQTERDKARLLEGMASSEGNVDLRALDDTISALDKRQFVLHSIKESGPRLFGTRWAMSYLPGPLTRSQISTLTEHIEVPEEPEASPVAAAAPAASAAAIAAEPPQLADNEQFERPPIADTVAVRYLDPTAPWASEVDAVHGGNRLVAAVAARVALVFNDTKAKLRHEVEWEAIFTPLHGPFDPNEAIIVDYDERDLRINGPTGALYVVPDAKIQNKTYFRSAQTALRDYLYRNESLQLLHNPQLKLYSHPGEEQEAFEARCRAAADDAADVEADKLRRSIETKLDRLRSQISKAEDKIREASFDADTRRRDAQVTMATDALSLLTGLLGGRSSTRGMSSTLSKRRMAGKADERLRTAENRYAELTDDLEELTQQLADDLAQIQEGWEARATDIQEIEIGLKKTNIGIDEVVLLWIPTE